MSDELKFFYTNSSEVAVSGYDIGIRFLRNGAVFPSSIAHHSATPDLPGKTLDSLLVSMSPGHAKAMVAGLYLSVMEYERQFGPITLPPDAQAAWDAQFKK